MKLGLALGGGGVRGLAHVPALEMLDELGIRPDRIAGTSMGAIIGAMYAAGVSGEKIRQCVQGLTILKSDKPKDVWEKKDKLSHWFKFFRFSKGRKAILSADGFLSLLFEGLEVEDFSDLEIPLDVVATDYYRDEKVVIGTGDLKLAVKASMAIPGVFEPVVHDGRVLVDGGMADNLPYGVLQDDCDIVIAIDVLPVRKVDETEPPNLVTAVLGMFDTLIERNTEDRLNEDPPTIYVRPELRDIVTLDFDQVESVYEQSAPAIEKLRKILQEMQERGQL